MTAPRTLLVLLLLSALGLSAPAQAQDKDPNEGPKRFDELSPEEQQAMMEKMMALATPGPEHELLANLAGEWVLESKVWHTPGGEAEVHAGVGKNRMILGGRFLEMHSTGGVMYGQKTESLTIVGFDRRKDLFTSTGFDTFGTYSVSASGPYDEGKKQTRMSGTDDDPTTGFTQQYDFVLAWIDADTYRFEIWFKDRSHGNKEPFKMVETVAKRVKK